MNAVIYVKCNSHNQIEQAVQSQINACCDYAKENGYTIIKQYIDINSRKQFKQMIKDSSKKQFQAVIVYSLDRFSRDKFESAVYKRELKLNGVKLCSTKENLSNDASSILMESILEGLAKYYSKELSKKVTNEGN